MTRELVAVFGDEIDHNGVTLFVQLEAPAAESCPAGGPASIHLEEERATFQPLPHLEHTPSQGRPRATIDCIYRLYFQIREERR